MVAKHKEPFVRNSMLVAAAEVLRSLPPPALAGAMLRSEAAGTPGDKVEPTLLVSSGTAGQLPALQSASPMQLAAGVVGRAAVQEGDYELAGCTADARLPARLQELHGAIAAEYRAACEEGGDDVRKALAAGCLQLQGELAEQAMASLDAEAQRGEAAAPEVVLPPW